MQFRYTKNPKKLTRGACCSPLFSRIEQNCIFYFGRSTLWVKKYKKLRFILLFLTTN